VDIICVAILSNGRLVSRSTLKISVATHKEFLSRDAMTVVILSQLDQHLNETPCIVQIVHNTRKRVHHISAVGLKLGVLGKILQWDIFECLEVLLVARIRFKEPAQCTNIPSEVIRRDSSVNSVTGYWVGRPGFSTRQDSRFSLRHSTQENSQPTQLSGPRFPTYVNGMVVGHRDRFSKPPHT
jgi:hypothetical protein